MPPEILTGIMQAATSIGGMLDSFAQVTPEFGQDLAQIKDLLQSYLAKVAMNGAGPTSPTATGPAFPAGGASMDRGIASAGSA
jgi:hypothetical protein